jgi:hypothetical protein
MASLECMNKLLEFLEKHKTEMQEQRPGYIDVLYVDFLGEFRVLVSRSVFIHTLTFFRAMFDWSKIYVSKGKRSKHSAEVEE